MNCNLKFYTANTTIYMFLPYRISGIIVSSENSELYIPNSQNKKYLSAPFIGIRRH